MKKVSVTPEERRLTIVFVLWLIASVYISIDEGFSVYWVVIGAGAIGGVVVSTLIDVTKRRNAFKFPLAFLFVIGMGVVLAEESLRLGAVVLSLTGAVLRLYKGYK